MSRMLDVGCRLLLRLAHLSLLMLLAGAPVIATTLPPLLNIAKIVGGGGHSCALSTSGAVQCWGENVSGQLGDGTNTQRLTPTAVSGLSSGVTAIAAGFDHTCAIRAGGALCWGNNANGQLGFGSINGRNTPTAVDAVFISGPVTAVAAGNAHSCALTSAGAVLCWGANTNGELGDNSTTQRLIPTPVNGLSSGVTMLALGADHSCALTNLGAVRCWGSNSFGQLGDNSTTQRLLATTVSGLTSGVTAISAGIQHTCALTAAGAVQCWGANFNGQVGDNSTVSRLVPTAVSGLSSGVTAIAAGGQHSCARTSTGAALCWGANFYGQLGDGSILQRLVPTAVSGLSSGVTTVGVGGFHSCALTTAGSAQCWGLNFTGQLGNNDATARLSPTAVTGLSTGVTAITAGTYHTCAVTSAGAALCWGYNFNGQLGDNTTADRSLPTAVSGLSSGVVAIDAGGSHTCALLNTGAMLCWGSNGSGQLGDNTTTQRLIPTQVTGLTSGVTAITAGGNHTCAISGAGALQCWGRNTNGQIGDGTQMQRMVPTGVTGLSSGATAIATGDQHTCAISSGGALRCWGSGSNGQIGDGSLGTRLVPSPVTGLGSGVTLITAGFGHTCAVTAAGAMQCWGRNLQGAIGNNSSGNSITVPTQVSGLTSGIVAIAGGFDHSCAARSTGATLCWGLNSSGQLGDGSTSNKLVPNPVSGLGNGVVDVTAGYYHSCARNSAGGMQCWGDPQEGQIGDGSTLGEPFPQNVVINDAPRAVAPITPAANNASVAPKSDASGRYIVFQSRASNLLDATDSNNSADIFRVDTLMGMTELVSLDNADAQVTGDSIEPSVSANGQFVVFVAPNAGLAKVLGESKAAAERRVKQGGFGIFMRNLISGTTQRVGSGLASGTGSQPQISPNANAVVFTGTNADSAMGATGQDNVFMLPLTLSGNTLTLGSLECVSCKSRSVMGAPVDNADGPSRDAVVSADGRYVAYETIAKNVTAGTASPCTSSSVVEIILRDLISGTTQRVSPPPGLASSSCGVTGSANPSIDYSGLNIAFESDQPLKPGDINLVPDVFSVVAGSTVFVRPSETSGGTDSNGPSTQATISGDGQTVVFVSAATNLDASFTDSNGKADLHAKRSNRTGGPERLSKSTTGVEANEAANRPALNYNATLIVFDSAASNLVSGDTNAQGDVFQRALPANGNVVFAAGFE